MFDINGKKMQNTEMNSNKISFVNLDSYSKTTQFLSEKIHPLINDLSIVWDAGCGKWNRMLMGRNVKTIIGTDIEFNRIRINRMINYGIVGDIERQNFKDEVFDLIVSNDVVEHVRAPDQFVKISFKILKNYGYVAITTPNKNSLFGIITAKISNKVNQKIFKTLFGKSNLNEVHYYRLNTEKQLRSSLRNYGFSNIDITYINKLGTDPTKRVLLGWYYQLCKIPLMRMFSPGLLCIAQKVV